MNTTNTQSPAPGVAAEREKFETWAREAFLQNRGNELVPHAVDHVFPRNDADHPEPGDYEDLPIHGPWTAWKARAAAGITEVAAWRHNKTHGLYDDESDVPLGDGDEWAEPLYLQPPSAAQAWKQGFQAGDDWRELVTGYYEAGNMGAPPEPPENPYTFDQFADERTASARGTAETEKAYQYTDGTLSVEREVLDALGVYARSRPEDDESWESWFQAAFDLSGERIRAVFRECKQRALASRTPAPGMAAELSEEALAIIEQSCGRTLASQSSRIRLMRAAIAADRAIRGGPGMAGGVVPASVESSLWTIKEWALLHLGPMHNITIAANSAHALLAAPHPAPAQQAAGAQKQPISLADAVRAARGGDAPPKNKEGFA